MLLLAGIDEAGYGPTLGPLCVGMSMFRVNEWESRETTPNLWKLLEKGVCRTPGRAGKTDSRGRVAIADSKELKLANSVTTTHPLVHLERGVLSFARLLLDDCPDCDDALHAMLGASLPAHTCYAGEAVKIPVAHTPAELGIKSNAVARACAKAGVSLALLRCTLLAEPRFNEIVRDVGSKAETTATALVEHLKLAWSVFEGSPPEARLGIVCDRQGGRMAYGDLLQRAFPDAEVRVVEQTESRSAYTIERNGRRAGVAFLVEAESAHLPVALASMVAKYARELAMMRFNRYWGGRASEVRMELKPTAGYSQDARRWLDQAGPLLTSVDREALIRIA